MKRVLAGVIALAMAAAVAAPAMALDPRPGVRLRALDKITGNATDLSARIGETIKFGRLNITVRACWGSPPEDAPESVAFLEVRAEPPPENEFTKGGQKSTKINAKGKSKPTGAPGDPDPALFSGWMYASSPGLSALEHPVYDVWVISCTAAPPATVAPPTLPATPQ